jgi:hypothetical protein
MVLKLAGVPQVVEEFHISGTAQTKPKLHARLRHLRTGRLTDHTFSEGERVPLADVQYRRVEFSYHDREDFVFSDVAWKPAVLDTGLEIMVPLFIAPGEKIRVDTTERKYAGRESEGKK